LAQGKGSKTPFVANCPVKRYRCSLRRTPERNAACRDELQPVGMNGRSRPEGDEMAVSVRAADLAAGRNPLAARKAAAYSASIDEPHPPRKDRPMNATEFRLSLTARLTAAVVTSSVVLGATVAGMQARDEAPSQVIALERVTVRAPLN
jgi:hypothetical protein